MERIFAEAAKARQRESEGKAGDSSNGTSSSTSGSSTAKDRPLPAGYTRGPNGVVLDPEGRPCRTCMNIADWATLTRGKRKEGDASAAQARQPTSSSSHTTTAAVASAGAATASLLSTSTLPTLPADCPPDVERLGNHTWTFLHSTAAAYPERASAAQQADMKGFLTLFGRLYPCGMCAADFREYMARPGNEPAVQGRNQLGDWMCRAHNDVNRKLGKKEFDCTLWRERWVDGWRDGRCEP